MKAIILKNKKATQFRLGDTSLESLTPCLHADTLFSAIANIYELVYQDAMHFIQLVEEGQIRFSSAFFALQNGNDKTVFFVPKPEIRYGSAGNGKQLKKIKYVSLGVLQDISTQLSAINDTLSTPIDILSYKQSQYFCMTEKEAQELKLPNVSVKWIDTIGSQHVKVHTEAQEDNLHTEVNLLLASNKASKIQPHFYFILDYHLSDENESQFMTCLRLLGDEGIGGSRSTGCGHYDGIEIKGWKWENGKSPFYLSLSPFIPESNEAFDSVLQYNLMQRVVGFQGYNNRRTIIRMIQEGAILKKNIKGRLVETGEIETPIYRYAKNLAIQL